MQELERLIRKFWSNETSQEENQRLLQLLDENKDHYRDHVRAEFEAQTMNRTEDDTTAGLLEKIHRSVGIEERPARVHFIRRHYRLLAVAAGIGAIVFSLFLMTPHPRRDLPVTAAEAAPPKPYLQQISCGPYRDTTLFLEDGSTVQLKKNSRLSMYRPLKSDRRDLWLEGAATFDVAKDRTRPFTVYAGEVETRVLGTRFSVNGSERGKVKVRLLEGRIVVSSGTTAGLKPLYLIPGQELSFDKTSRLYTVNSIRSGHDRPVSQDAGSGQSGLVFHKEPLSRVFGRIGAVYKTPLSYRKEELSGLYFTGTFLSSDNLQLVLSAICNVHGLTFREEGDSITITRSH